MPSFLFGYSTQEVLQAQWDIITTFQNCLSRPYVAIYNSLDIPKNHRQPLDAAQSLGNWFGERLTVFPQLAECQRDLAWKTECYESLSTRYNELLGEPFQQEFGAMQRELGELKERHNQLELRYSALQRAKDDEFLNHHNALLNARQQHSREVERLEHEIAGLRQLVARQQEELLRLRPTDKPRTKAARKTEGDAP